MDAAKLRMACGGPASSKIFELRRHTRALILASVTIRGDDECRGHLRNISVGGALIECSQLRDVGAPLELDFHLGGGRLVVYARVLRCVAIDVEAAASYAMGLEFEPLSLRDQRRIENHVRGSQTT